MTPFILDLASPQADLDTTGGKGMSLARMLAAGLPVPGGFHITTTAYREFVAANELQPSIRAALDGLDPADMAALEAASAAIAGLFMSASIPAEIEQAVTGAYAPLQDTSVAVRSSATAEDLPGASFAGQQETYLNIHGTGPLLAAVKRCWGSLWTARAIAYRLKNQIDQETVALAVVVQELVAADAAGILFTANPTNGRREELVINAAWGLGEAVVSGAVSPDTLTVDKTRGRVLRREIAEKKVMTVRTPDGTREQPVPADRQSRPVLSAAQTGELARLGTRIEQFYGMPMDVEWALAGGRFYVLQARPITALPPEWKVPDPSALYARGSLAEHIPSPVTPLFATLGLELANQATLQMWERLIGPTAKTMIAGGGMYVPLNDYVYGGIRMRGSNMWPVMKMSISQIGPVARGSVQRWRIAREKLASAVATWDDRPVREMTGAELLEGVRAVYGAACVYFTDIQMTLPAASSSEIMLTRFYNSLVRRRQDPEAAVFLRGFETMALRAEKSLFDLSRWVQTLPQLEQALSQTPSADLAAALAGGGLPVDGWDEFRSRFQAHLEEFGRTAYEFDFANPTPQEAPSPLLDVLKGYLSGQAQDPHVRQAEAAADRETAERVITERLGWPRRGWFLRLLRFAQETAPMREDSIFDLGMGHPTVRRMLAELGRRFAAAGAIQSAEDIYWLEQAEVERLIAGLSTGDTLPDFSGRVPERKTLWQAARKITPPIMVPERSGWSRFIQGGEAVRKDGKMVLKGVGTSAGVVTAPACVLYGPEDFDRLKPGDVLVAVTTTPAWTPLFALASAVVTDIGGPLSHSSIVAREYGIPAVMAARGATRAVQNGQAVTVDGSAGTVTLEPVG